MQSDASGTTVRYVRDATGRIVARTVTGAQSQTQRYSFGGAGDSASVVLDTNNQVIEAGIGLPGGVMLTKRAAGDVWSYPNIHGDVTAVADGTGVKQGTTFTYDPYGNLLAGLPDNSDGSLDYGWLGSHQRGLEHATDLQPVIEMGARQYHPLLGRFLEVDPIEGGSCNDYDYVCGDPVNAFDLTGTVCQKVWYFRVCSPDVAPSVKYKGQFATFWLPVKLKVNPFPLFADSPYRLKLPNRTLRFTVGLRRGSGQFGVSDDHDNSRRVTVKGLRRVRLLGGLVPPKNRIVTFEFTPTKVPLTDFKGQSVEFFVPTVLYVAVEYQVRVWLGSDPCANPNNSGTC